MIAASDITQVLRTRDQQILDWAIDQAGGDSTFTLDDAREVWETHLAFRLLRLGYTVNEAARMLGHFLPYDALPERDKGTEASA